MSRLNYYGALGLLTWLESHIEKSRKVSGPRSLQCSHWGYVCPVDTPDGENCGLVKNLALLSWVTSEIDDHEVLRTINKLELIELGFYDIRDMNKNKKIWNVILNGKIVGGIFDWVKFVKNFKILRKKGIINKNISLFEDEVDRIIEIWSDAGRLVWPLINIQEYKNSYHIFLKLIENFKIEQNDSNGITIEKNH